jgi:hypothetical protein
LALPAVNREAATSCRGKPSGNEVNLTLNGNRQVHVHLERETLELLEEARALLAKPVEVERSQ